MDSEQFEYTSVDTDAIRVNMVENGYSIAKGVVPVEQIKAMRGFWLKTFKEQATLAPIIWGPYLGEPNRVHFHNAQDNCLYRAYDYLWNKPLHQLSRDIGVGLSRLRNRVTESGAFTGETYCPDRYGIYFTVSYYPPGEGWLHDHQDQTDGRRQWHYILPMTFMGENFADGGLHLVDRQGEDVDVDRVIEAGDVLFFDGGLTHGVRPIVSGPDMTLGRMQMFSIPTFIDLPQQSDRFAEEVSISRFLKGKLRPIKNRLRGIAGPLPERADF